MLGVLISFQTKYFLKWLIFKSYALILNNNNQITDEINSLHKHIFLSF